MEVVVLLKIQVNHDHPTDTIHDTKSKIRSYIADIVGQTLSPQKGIDLICSALAEVDEDAGVIEIQPSSEVIDIREEQE
jgi:hypothetical protein